MIPANFEYHRPSSVDEAISLLTRYGDEGRLLAGGHSLIPLMKTRLAAPSHLIDIQAIDDLKQVGEAGGELTLGALVTQAELIASETVADTCPILREAALLIADPQVRYCGTVGGNVANGDPGNDMPALMMCLGARYALQGPDGEREVAARDYYEAAYFTAINEDEVLTEVRIPVPAAGHGYAYSKMKRKVGDYATAATAVVLTLKGGKCASASIALTNVGQTPLFAEAAGQALVGSAVDGKAIAAAVAAAEQIADPVSDMRGPPDFRRHVAGVMTQRAIETALSRAKGG
ncbi:MAG: xanthine dehydrogenase family protein subunit M [Inquilinus sp.]|nr:xanthine dehydrogenase family protein subunit M [Inquilinus sp.]